MDAAYKLISDDGREFGPVPLEELRAWVEEGRVAPDSLVWSSEIQRWRPAVELPEIRWLLPRPTSTQSPDAPDAAPRLIPAGFAPRLAAGLLDALSVWFLLRLAQLPWADKIQALVDDCLRQKDLPNPDPVAIMLPFLVLLGFYLPVSLAYYLGFYTRFSATPGKLMLGLRIVTEDGSPLTFSRAFRRYAAEGFSGLVLGVGYLWILVSPEKRALHDLLAGTRVVFAETSSPDADSDADPRD